MFRAVWNGGRAGRNGTVKRDAAWYYPQPSPAASRIAGHVAFWRGVKVET